MQATSKDDLPPTFAYNRTGWISVSCRVTIHTSPRDLESCPTRRWNGCSANGQTVHRIPVTNGRSSNSVSVSVGVVNVPLPQPLMMTMYDLRLCIVGHDAPTCSTPCRALKLLGAASLPVAAHHNARLSRVLVTRGPANAVTVPHLSGQLLLLLKLAVGLKAGGGFGHTRARALTNNDVVIVVVMVVVDLPVGQTGLVRA